MAKKSKPNINMSPESLEDFIWMSCRYCVGRKTIAAAAHADTILSVLKSNPGAISEDRMKFNADDIRNEINNALSLKSNISVSNWCGSQDIFSAILYELNNYDNHRKTKFLFDTTSMKIVDTISLNDELSPWMCVDYDYLDLIPWIKLANWMDKSTHKTVIVEYEGKIESIVCYPFPIKINDGDKVKYEQRWTHVENPVDVTTCSYISPEYITVIE